MIFSAENSSVILSNYGYNRLLESSPLSHHYSRALNVCVIHIGIEPKQWSWKFNWLLRRVSRSTYSEIKTAASWKNDEVENFFTEVYLFIFAHLN